LASASAAFAPSLSVYFYAIVSKIKKHVRHCIIIHPLPLLTDDGTFGDDRTGDANDRNFGDDGNGDFGGGDGDGVGGVNVSAPFFSSLDSSVFMLVSSSSSSSSLSFSALET
jgi:hypothetical protein